MFILHSFLFFFNLYFKYKVCQSFNHFSVIDNAITEKYRRKKD